MTDLGYYGLEQDGFKLLMPIKKKKNLPLFDVEKKYNKMIGKIRVVIEHIRACPHLALHQINMQAM